MSVNTLFIIEQDFPILKMGLQATCPPHLFFLSNRPKRGEISRLIQKNVLLVENGKALNY